MRTTQRKSWLPLKDHHGRLGVRERNNTMQKKNGRPNAIRKKRKIEGKKSRESVLIFAG